MARLSLQRVRSVLGAEFAAIRNRDPEIDAGDVTSSTMPLLLGRQRDLIAHRDCAQIHFWRDFVI